MYMPQFNMNLDANFEQQLLELMTLRNLKSKAAAIRVVVAEALKRAKLAKEPINFDSFRGIAVAANPNPSPQFQSDDDLWGAS